MSFFRLITSGLKQIPRSAYGAGIAIALLYLVMQLAGITCPLLYLTGISCAGCGMSRACLSAIRFHLRDAFYYHPLFWTLPFLALFYLCRFRFSKKTRNFVLYTTVAVFLGVYIMRFFIPDQTIVVFHPGDGLILRILNRIFTYIAGPEIC